MNALLLAASAQRDPMRDTPATEAPRKAFRPFLSEGERYAANEAADGREYTTDVHYLETIK